MHNDIFRSERRAVSQLAECFFLGLYSSHRRKQRHEMLLLVKLVAEG
jgi:hypothetical protein